MAIAPHLLVMSLPPLILTLKLDSQTFEAFDRWRQQYFPPERNWLPAHVTLFHHLPGEHLSEVRATLARHCTGLSPLPLSFPELRFLGRGVAVALRSQELLQLRQQLAQEWALWLNRQDQQSYQPHITLQNKVEPGVARQLYDQLGQIWQERSGRGEGLLLWHYQGGPWQLAGEFPFQGQSADMKTAEAP